MVGVIDACAFHQQHKALVIARQVGNGGAGHFRQRGLASAIVGAVVFVLHVVRLEQAQHRRCGGSLGQELLLVPDIAAGRVGRLPFVDQIAAIGTPAVLLRVFRIGHAGRGEVAAAAGQQDLRATAIARGIEQLLGDVAAAFGLRLGRDVGFPVALRAVRIGGRRGGVGQAGGGDDAGAQAGAIGQLQPAQHRLVQGIGAVSALACRDADCAHMGFHPGGNGGHGAGRIRGLRVGVVGLGKRGGREMLPAQQILLARGAGTLAFEDACGSYRGQAHAIAEEHDHILRLPGHRTAGRRFGGAVAIPPLRGFTLRAADDRHLDGECAWLAGHSLGGGGGAAGAGAEQQGRQGGCQQSGAGHGITSNQGVPIMSRFGDSGDTALFHK